MENNDRYKFTPAMHGAGNAGPQSFHDELISNEVYETMLRNMAEDMRRLEMTWQREEAYKKIMEAAMWFNQDSALRQKIEEANVAMSFGNDILNYRTPSPSDRIVN